MSEDTQPAEDEDRRDEQLAALLEVPPLDDVTRRRLVRRALDESGGETRRPGRRARVLAVAAAVLAVLVIGGGAALVLRDDGEDTTVATRNEDARGAGEEDSTAAPAPVPIGDLGDITDPAVLRERLASAAASPAPAGSDAESVFNDAPACGGDRVPATLDPPIQIGSGTYAGTPALVFVGARDDERLAVVLDAASCGLLAEVPIQVADR